MAVSFDELSTTRFQLAMRPVARALYAQLFPGCTVQDLREAGNKVHILDKHFGIDTLISLPDGQWFTVQEKYRQNKYVRALSLRVDRKCPDFTQEFKNADGTQYETPGEWFTLASQLYFYGWASEDNASFEKWVLLDIAKYKLLVEKSGGLDAMGKKFFNREHGRSSFYCIPVLKLRPAFIASHRPELCDPSVFRIYPEPQRKAG